MVKLGWKSKMKKIILTLAILFSFNYVMANMLNECYKIYSKDADSLFMSALSAISSSDKYEISEIQTKNGYILFLAGSKYYLLTLTKRYQNQTEIKILPQNSDFSQGSEVAKDLFLLIDNEIKTPMGLVK